jgi:hypothetical protein
LAVPELEREQVQVRQLPAAAARSAMAPERQPGLRPQVPWRVDSSAE